MDRFDAVVVGAGVVGLAVARALAAGGREVLVLEAEATIGSGVSSRNSEVVHAGLYYPPGSLKARWCARGRTLLYGYCAARGIGHRRCGKLVVATHAAEHAALQTILERGRASGADDLELIEGDRARAMEPALACSAALWSPSSGIVDSHALMLALLADAEAAGALLALRTPMRGARRDGGAWIVETGADGGFAVATGWLVNAAGLGAQAVAAAIDGFPRAAIPRRHLAKGHYFSLAGRAPFSRLIYPTPVDGGLGVHLTLDLAGQARFGPDVQWLRDGERWDYAVDPSRAAAFEAAVRRYWPGLPAGSLQPAYTGVRPKLSGPGEPAADFALHGPPEHGIDGVVHLFGIESPGLTASLAIAEAVQAMVGDL